MTPEDFVRAQQEWAVPVLSSLIEKCLRRYLGAARLLELRGDLVEKLQKAASDGGADLSPLNSLWITICDRFGEEIYDPQLELFRDHDTVMLDKWGVFLYQKLIPALCRDDECVRNVLRAVELLPSRSRHGAARALAHFVEEMVLPDQLPSWFQWNEDA